MYSLLFYYIKKGVLANTTGRKQREKASQGMTWVRHPYGYNAEPAVSTFTPYAQ